MAKRKRRVSKPKCGKDKMTLEEFTRGMDGMVAKGMLVRFIDNDWELKYRVSNKFDRRVYTNPREG